MKHAALLKNPIHFLSLGFGSGLAPKAPGTFGTVAAIPVAILAACLGTSGFIIATVLACLAGIYFCGYTAKAMGEHDHPAIVWDEIAGFMVATICILIYVSFRFEWRIALASVIGLVQDVFMVLGIFSLLQIQVDLTILAALLAVIGYSLNDSIVISDRIRENFRKLRNTEVPDVINISLSQCLSRTLITSLTTIMVLLTLYFFGGQMVNGFALAMLVGVIVGTYSSTFTRTTIMVALGISREDLMPPEVEKEGEEQENLI